MLNKEKHRLIMGRILRDIYSDTSIAPLLGFKGGTCAYFFYQLPRFSVDLDFDFLEPNNTAALERVFTKIKKNIEKYGAIKEARIKRYTIFFLLSYGDADHNIKLEINTRSLVPEIKTHYELKEYLGISLWASKKEYLFSSKLIALTQRTETAMRDIYDVWYFAKNNWDINAESIKARTGKTCNAYLNDCITTIEQVGDKQILQGLGELISEKEKEWIKKNLKNEVVFLLKN